MNLCISAIFTLIYLLSQNRRNFAKGVKYTAENYAIAQNTSKSTQKLITVDVTKHKSNDEYKYEYKFYKLSHTFIANPGHLIEKVTFGESVLWDSKDYGDCYSNKVFVGKNYKGEKVFRVYFPTEAPEIPATLYRESEKEHEAEEQWQTESMMYGNQYDLRPPKPKHRQTAYDAVLSRAYQRDTEQQIIMEPEYYYETGAGAEVKAGETPKAEIGPEPAMARGIEIQHIRTRHRDRQTKIGTLAPRVPETRTETKKPKLVTLEIRNKKSTDEVRYEFYEEHGTHIFTPNRGYLIHDVTRKGKVMWECENGVYPEKVLLFPDESGEMTLRVQFPDQVTRQPPPRIPEPEPEPIIERVHPTSVSEMSKMPSSEKDTTELIRPPRYSMAMPEAMYEPKGKSITDKDHRRDTRTRVVPRDSELAIERPKYDRDAETQTEEESETEQQYDNKHVDLDISTTRPTRSYDISFVDGDTFWKLLFTARKPYKFKQVLHGSSVIWEGDEVKEYAYKVIYDRLYKTLIIFSFNGVTTKLQYNKTQCKDCINVWGKLWTKVPSGRPILSSAQRTSRWN